jgi:hypothetical protein
LRNARNKALETSETEAIRWHYLAYDCAREEKMHMKQEAFPTSAHWKCSDAERTSELEAGKLGRHIPPGTFYNLAARRIYQQHFYDYHVCRLL